MRTSIGCRSSRRNIAKPAWHLHRQSNGALDGERRYAIRLRQSQPHPKSIRMSDKRFVIAPPPQPVLAIAGSAELFPVRRIWCVGRNYEEHIKEMGHDVRDPPFFFSKPADAIVPDGGTASYPSLTKDMHHEV